MLFSFLQGILLGLGLSASVGITFFALINTSLTQGFARSLFFIAGTFLSDVFISIFSYFGLSTFMQSDNGKLFVGSIGTVILVGLGVRMIRKKKSSFQKEQMSTFGVKLKLFVKGFLINITNPFSYILRIGIVALIHKLYLGNTSMMLSFLSGVLITLLCIDITKSFFAGRIKRYLNEKYIFWINRGVGFLLVFFGVFLVYRLLFAS